MAAPSPAVTGLLLTLTAASVYGAQIAFARVAAIAGISGVSLVVYRVFLMMLVVLALAGIGRKSLAVVQGERRSLLALSIASATVGTAYLSSVAFIPVTVAVVILYTFPALIVLASPFIDGERLRPLMIAVVALALIGVILVVGPVFEGLDPRGLALAALASVTAAIQFFSATRCRRTGVLAKAFWIHLFSLPAVALVGWMTTSLQPPAVLALSPLAVGLTIFGYIVGFLLQLAALARSTAIVAGIAFCAEPVMAALSSALVLGERLSPVQLAGGALVIAAIGLNASIALRATRGGTADAAAP